MGISVPVVVDIVGPSEGIAVDVFSASGKVDAVDVQNYC